MIQISDAHLICLLKLIADICLEFNLNLNDDLATRLADLAIIELSSSGGEQASELLVALSQNHCSQAIGALIIK